MAITRPNVPGFNTDAPTQFDPRPSQWPDAPVAEQHITGHAFGAPETAPTE